MWYFFNGLTVLILVFFTMYHNLTPKRNKILTFFLLLLPLLFVAFFQRLFKTLDASWTPFVFLGVYVLLCLLLFRDSTKSKLFVAIINWFAFVAVSMLLLILVTLFGDKMTDSQFLLQVYLVVNSMLFAVLLFINFLRVRSGGQRLMNPYYLISFFFLAVSQLFLSLGIVSLVGNDYFRSSSDLSALAGISGNNSLFFFFRIVACFVALIADFFFIGIMVRSSRAEAIREEYRLRERQNEIDLENYKAQEANILSLRKLYHDMANILQTMNMLAQEVDAGRAKDVQIATAQLTENFEKKRPESFTKNSLVNAILVRKAGECKKKQIAYTFDILLPKNIGIEEIDLCKAFTNIIDNAIESAELAKKQSIVFRSFLDDKTLYLVTENELPVNNELNKNKKIHGYGQRIMNDLAMNYHGSYTATVNGSLYSAVLVLNCRKN